MGVWGSLGFLALQKFFLDSGLDTGCFLKKLFCLTADLVGLFLSRYLQLESTVCALDKLPAGLA